MIHYENNIIIKGVSRVNLFSKILFIRIFTESIYVIYNLTHIGEENSRYSGITVGKTVSGVSLLFNNIQYVFMLPLNCHMQDSLIKVLVQLRCGH